MPLLALALYLAVGLSSALLIVKVSAALRSASHGDARIHDPYEAAFLAGGPARVADAALAALHTDGRVVVGGPGVVTTVRQVAHDPVEREVFRALATAPSGALHVVRQDVMRSPAVQEIGHALAARGLMTPPRQHSGLSTWGLTQGILCLIGLPLSVFATVVQFMDSGHKPVGLPFVLTALPALIPGMVIGFSQANRAGRRVAPEGRRALRSYSAAHAHAAPGVVAFVALRGVGALPDPHLRAQLTGAARLGRGSRSTVSHAPYAGHDSAACSEPVWCASSGSGSGCGAGSGGSGGSGCGGSSGSSCGSSSGSSCGSSSGSSCGSSSSS
ncbi:TIGR04222 domain-containing membrane protein [Streptomyces sp. PKU-EA00015]|uniref:TIGR04222 domain-containing membrane protein n=1 Tax=Streptomyces sp. PKU-EA00015 TaxID=2748326 RepID=UPI0015A2156C|nr:TIGR04222 domain-containing membrane protein [Streptomyces sp. PKU-EA00015]NWF29332.1 TIGR04222 domain-containing membrane protein [Streptomyces sp. PKU-EA00015]